MKITEKQLLEIEKLGYNPRIRFYKYFIPIEQLPEQQVIVDWLRDTYNLHIGVNIRFSYGSENNFKLLKKNVRYCYKVYYFGKDFDKYDNFSSELVKSYEECLNLAITESIKTINILK